MSGPALFEVERHLPAPITEVFRWWTEPQLLARWMTPVGTVTAAVDLRVGGALSIVMSGGDRVIEHSGTYTEVDPPRRLAFTWASPFTGKEPSLVTVELEPDGDLATILRLRHSELPDAVAESHRGGWGKMLDRLSAGLKGVRAMPVDVVTEIVIDRPPEVVAEFASDPTNAPKWYINIKSVQWKTEPPVRVGSQLAFTAKFMGKQLSYTYEVVEFVPNAKFVMRTAEGPFPMETTYTWEAVGSGSTRMALRNRGEPSGFSKIAAPLMASAMARATRKDLAMLKRMLEGAA